MNRRFVIVLFSVLISCFSVAFGYDRADLNRRLASCTPTKDFNAGGSAYYQISGLTGSICIFKIENNGANNKPDLICKVPYTKMPAMTSPNPLTVQRLKSQYCVMSIRSTKREKKIYY